MGSNGKANELGITRGILIDRVELQKAASNDHFLVEI